MARPGSCRKPPGALYIEVERSEFSPFPLLSAVDGQAPREAALRRVWRCHPPGRASYGPTDAAAEREVRHHHQQGRPAASAAGWITRGSLSQVPSVAKR
jgi:hypothetical protein